MTVRFAGALRDHLRDEAVTLADIGRSIRQIAKDLRVSRYLARRLLIEAKPCTECTGTDDCHQYGCQQPTAIRTN